MDNGDKREKSMKKTSTTKIAIIGIVAGLVGGGAAAGGLSAFTSGQSQSQHQDGGQDQHPSSWYTPRRTTYVSAGNARGAAREPTRRSDLSRRH